MKINLLLVHGLSFAYKIAEELLGDGSIDLCVNAYSHENKIYADGKEIRVSWGMCMKAEYEQLCDWNAIPALSKQLMEDMLRYESMAIKLGMRTTNYPIAEYELEKMSYLKHVRFWYYVLMKYKINAVYFDEVPHFQYTYVIYALAQILKINIIICDVCSIPGIRVYGNSVESIGEDISINFRKLKSAKQEEGVALDGKVADYYNRYSNVEQEIQHRLASKFIDNERNRMKCAMSSDMYVKNKILVDRCRIAMSSVLKHGGFNWYKNCLPELNRRFYLAEEISSFKKSHMASYMDYDKKAVMPDYSEKYIYFALQLTPEATTMPLAGVFAEQYTSVQLLARIACKYNMKLYVKEHFVQLFRDKGVYKMLENISNVVLIHSSVSSFELMKNSVAVATQTGTCILEAALSGKIALCFGQGYYWKGLPSLFEITDEIQGAQVLGDILEGKIAFTKNDIKKYFYAIQQNCIYGYVTDCDFDEVDSEDYRRSVAEKIRLIKEKLLVEKEN